MKNTRLTIIGKPRRVGSNRKVRCRCDCGRIVDVYVNHLQSGRTRSCGNHPWKKHGGHGTRLYKIWLMMHSRCYRKSDVAFSRYGGRGIRVCRSWFDFAQFRQWAMSHGYQPTLTLDRRRNDRSYSPSNCRWATMAEQCQNRRKKPNTTSKYLGVCRMRKKWRASICARGRRYYLGHFATERQAALVRDKAAKRLHGRAAVLNFS